MIRTRTGPLVRPAPGVTPHVLTDGRMELHCARTGRRFRCDAFGAATWIALRQHGGDPGSAARTLALAWDDDETAVRASLDRLVAALRRAGLIVIAGGRARPVSTGRVRHSHR